MRILGAAVKATACTVAAVAVVAGVMLLLLTMAVEDDAFGTPDIDDVEDPVAA